MSYEEKGSWVYLVVMLGTCAVYVAVILRRAAGVPIADVAYLAPLLWSLAVSMGLSIVGRIAFEIARPSESHRLDVRDRDINRHADYVGGTVLTLAMLVPFGLTVAEVDHFWIANAMYAAFAASAIVGSVVKVVAYRRGL